MKLLSFITLPLYLLDQVTKWLVLRFISTDEFVPVIPGFFYLVQVHNTGAAFGMLKNNNLFFMILASFALILVAVLARRGAFADASSRVGAALLVSGVLGNLTDRILHGYVIDFLDVILPWYGHWPAFNVADSAICVAAALFLISGFLASKKKT
jgi:signal peptidase II